MILDTWLEQLRKAGTEEQVVNFVHAQLERITAAAQVPEVLRDHVLLDGDDLRRMAASLSKSQGTATCTREETDLLQQMLILFSLATDRLNQLEGHGLARRAPDRALPLR
jgi:hypothetical protein